MTLPGEDDDRKFQVSIKWQSQVSLYTLQEALEGRARLVPRESIDALDVILRHLPSMKSDKKHWRPFLRKLQVAVAI